MKTVTVRAAFADRPVPMEGVRRRFITADQPVTVGATPYYRKQIADGDLVVIPATGSEAP